jgi:hypothetical protein
MGKERMHEEGSFTVKGKKRLRNERSLGAPIKVEVLDVKS